MHKVLFVKINCDYCEEIFEPPLKRINLNKKRGWKNYCSVPCRNKAHSKRMVGRVGFWIGKKRPEHSERMKSKNNPSYGRSGEDNPGWKGGITLRSIRERQTSENRQFVKNVLRRDNYTCQICNKRGGDLAVDHIMPWSLHPKLRQDPENVRTLCKQCHLKYGANPNCSPQKLASSPISLTGSNQYDTMIYKSGITSFR